MTIWVSQPKSRVANLPILTNSLFIGDPLDYSSGGLCCNYFAFMVGSSTLAGTIF